MKYPSLNPETPISPETMTAPQAGAIVSATPSAYFAAKIVMLRINGSLRPGSHTRPPGGAFCPPGGVLFAQPMAKPTAQQASQSAASIGATDERNNRLVSPQ